MFSKTTHQNSPPQSPKQPHDNNRDQFGKKSELKTEIDKAQGPAKGGQQTNEIKNQQREEQILKDQHTKVGNILNDIKAESITNIFEDSESPDQKPIESENKGEPKSEILEIKKQMEKEIERVWKEFKENVNRDKIVRNDATREKMAEVLGDEYVKVKVESSKLGNNIWYPWENNAKKFELGEKYLQYKYVEPGKSYVGQEDCFCSESNFCVLLLLLDPVSRIHFVAHISAVETPGVLKYELPGDPSYEFMRKHLMEFKERSLSENTLTYIFTSEINNFSFPNSMTRDPLDNALVLLSECYPDVQLKSLLQRARLVGGKDDYSWLAKSSVRIQLDRNPNSKRYYDMRVVHSFAV